MAALMLLSSNIASSNPVSPDIPGAFEEAIAGIRSCDPTWPDSVFVQIIGGKNTRFLETRGLSLLEEDFGIFAPLVVKAQSPPYVIDYKVQEWYWNQANQGQREAMLAGLRTWLTDPIEDAPFTRWGVTTRVRSERHRALTRVEAAELLVDYGDRESLPLIESLRDSLAESFGGLQNMPDLWVEVWWYLYQAGHRIDHPDEAVLCDPVGVDRLRLTANPEDINRARYVNFFVGHHPEMPVDHDAARRVLALLEGSSVIGTCRDRIRAPCSQANAGMMIQFRDGRELTVSYSSRGGLVCSDNTRYYRWAYEISHAELVGLLKEIDDTFELEKPKYPWQG